jgi:hypothetical protein
VTTPRGNRQGARYAELTLIGTAFPVSSIVTGSGSSSVRFSANFFGGANGSQTARASQSHRGHPRCRIGRIHDLRSRGDRLRRLHHHRRRLHDRYWRISPIARRPGEAVGDLGAARIKPQKLNGKRTWQADRSAVGSALGSRLRHLRRTPTARLQTARAKSRLMSYQLPHASWRQNSP